MMAPTTLVTIHFANQPFDLAVPAEIAIRDLIPLLLAALGRQSDGLADTSAAAWGLGRLGDAAPLPAAQTLAQAGIVDGEELLLQASAAWSVAHEASTTTTLLAQRALDRWVI